MGKGARWFAVAVMAGACAGSAMGTGPRWREELLRDGDVLLLSASSWRGALVQAADGGEGLYAHAGLVGFVAGVAWLYHATPAGQRGVTAEPLGDFLRRQRVGSVRALRPANPVFAAGVMAYAREQAGRGVPFDRDFDLGSDRSLYCTELIWRAYRAAGVDLLASRSRPLRQVPLLGAVLWPADFNDMPELRPVSAFTTPTGVQ